MKFEGEVRELELIPALVGLGSEGFTGALRFENDSIIKIVYFKGGAVLSASTNDRADAIDEILLKSGKISRDHVKQALSKRKDDETLGDALLGLGFITRKELTWARRVQLVGILRSIVNWQSGSYTVVADYLPKREDGPTFQLGQVVLELVLTDGDRSKYDGLLDSGAAVFRPSSTFEEQFPNLGLNQEAEAVVRLINGTRTASEVVAESTSDAFNVYKLMHALSLLGLLERAPGGFGAGSEDAGVSASISPTIEMPMDFGTTPDESPEQTVDLDFTATPGSGADVSWQAPVEQPAGGEQPGELLPSIDDDLSAPAPTYDDQVYTPSVPISGPDVASDYSSVESLGSMEIPESLPVHDDEPEPGAQRPGARKVVSPSPSGGGGKKVAFLVVGLLILSAIAYSAWVYFTRPGDEPTPPIAQIEEPGPSASEPVPASEEPPVEDETSPPVEPPETLPAATQEPAPVTPSTTTPPRAEPRVPATPSRLGTIAREHSRAAANVAFTVQFALLCQDYSVENAMKVGGSEFWFIPINYQGRDCYRAFWGRYPTRAEAERGAASVPASLSGGKAVVVEPAKLVN
jgi:hypothetical protein